jgi:hypothetical protein
VILDPAHVTAVLVTRGNADVTEILASWEDAGFVEQLVWDNGARDRRGLGDSRLYGRWKAVGSARHSVVFVQDDDVIVDAHAVLDRYEPGRLVAAMPESRWADYPDSCLVGWGAVMDKDVPLRALERYLGVFPPNEWFLTDCDVVVTALSPRTVFDAGMPNHLPWAEGADRMFRQDDHLRRRTLMLERARELRRGPDDDRRVR